MRETTNNDNDSQSTQYNPWNFNELFKVENFTESFNQRSMMQPVIEGEKPAIKACRSQGTNKILDQISRW